MNNPAFTWLTKQSVLHVDGFLVKSAGRFAMAYVEGGKQMTIDVQDGRLQGGQHYVDIRPGAFLHWDSETGILPTREQERIERNFIDAMRFMGSEVVKAGPDV